MFEDDALFLLLRFVIFFGISDSYPRMYPGAWPSLLNLDLPPIVVKKDRVRELPITFLVSQPIFRNVVAGVADEWNAPNGWNVYGGGISFNF